MSEDKRDIKEVIEKLWLQHLDDQWETIHGGLDNMKRDAICFLYIRREVENAIKGKTNRHLYTLSLPYEVVWVKGNAYFEGDNYWDGEGKRPVREYSIGSVNLYGFDTVYNPDMPIRLIAK